MTAAKITSAGLFDKTNALLDQHGDEIVNKMQCIPI